MSGSDIMEKDRGYYRRQRKRTIRRKRGILFRLGGREYYDGWTRGAEGRLAKGKIHCSCPICRRKSYDELSMRDKRAKDKAISMVRDFYVEGGKLNTKPDPEYAQQDRT